MWLRLSDCNLVDQSVCWMSQPVCFSHFKTKEQNLPFILVQHTSIKRVSPLSQLKLQLSICKLTNLQPFIKINTHYYYFNETVDEGVFALTQKSVSAVNEETQEKVINHQNNSRCSWYSQRRHICLGPL